MRIITSFEYLPLRVDKGQLWERCDICEHSGFPCGKCQGGWYLMTDLDIDNSIDELRAKIARYQHSISLMEKEIDIIQTVTTHETMI